MNNERLFQALTRIDEKIIDDALNEKQERVRSLRRSYSLFKGLALASLCVLLVGGVILPVGAHRFMKEYENAVVFLTENGILFDGLNRYDVIRVSRDIQAQNFRNPSIEEKTKVFLLGWTNALKNTLNQELDAGRYVMISAAVTFNGSTTGHNFVITGKTSDGKYSLWDPYCGVSFNVLQSKLFSASFEYARGQQSYSVTMTSFFICNEESN